MHYDSLLGFVKNIFLYESVRAVDKTKVFWIERYEEMETLLQLRYAEIHLQYTETENTELKAQIEENCRRIAELEYQIEEKQAQICAIYSSRGWRFVRVMYKIRDKIFPSGSLRRKIAGKIWRAFRRVKDKFRRRHETVKQKNIEDSTLENKKVS